MLRLPTPSRREVLAGAAVWAVLAGAPGARASDEAPLSTEGGHPRWTTLPPTPDLPATDKRGMLPVNGTRIFHAEFGTGHPVILLHGGMGSSRYWGRQIRHLAGRSRVIVMDTRGHGQSPLAEPTMSYGLLAQDVAGLMDALGIPKASIVGWSDGAITGLILAMTQPERVDRLFAFGGNVSRRLKRRCAGECPTFVGYVRRCKAEYEQLSRQPDRWPELTKSLRAMWHEQGDFTDAELARIRAATVIADGAYDEIIKPVHAAALARRIRSARPLLLPKVSHFALLQDPAGFNAALDRFLA